MARGAITSGERLWLERMSGSYQLSGWLGLALGLLALAFGVTQLVDGDNGVVYVVLGLALAWFSVVGSLRPVVEAWSHGIHVRNVLHETWVPWATVVGIVPNVRVNVILDGGEFVGVWAVNRQSRLPFVVDRLTDSWDEHRDPPGGNAVVVRRLVGPPAWAVALVVATALVALVAAVAS